MSIKSFAVLLLITSSLTLSGCASSLKGDTYSRDDARQVQTVEFGTVQQTRFVQIEGTKTPIGGIAGAAVGGIAASSIGDGTGSQIASVLGAIAGGLAGAAAEEQLTKTQGIELLIKRDNSNEVISVVQAYDEQNPIQIGDRVRITQVNGQTRVAR